MFNDPIRAVFPTLCDLLTDSPVDRDIDAALDFAKEGGDALWEALRGGLFTQSELMWHLTSPLDPDLYTGNVRELEANLAEVVRTLGMSAARAAYRKKLLVNKKETFEDVCYEIAVTARACQVLDKGSIALERPIPDADRQERDWKNTDIYGTYKGQPVRIEVTVLHESLATPIHFDLDEIVRTANVSSTFRLKLRKNYTDEAGAQQVRALIELLHEHHMANGEQDVEIDGTSFTGRRGSYLCDQESSPIESVDFTSDEDFEAARGVACDFSEERHEIIHACSTRNLTPPYIRDDYPNPKGVVTSAELPSAPTNEPVSTKIHQMLDGKLGQCEPGMVNIVAFGVPYPMNDNDVRDAVQGVSMLMVSSRTDPQGGRQPGSGKWVREGRAPFVRGLSAERRRPHAVYRSVSPDVGNLANPPWATRVEPYAAEPERRRPGSPGANRSAHCVEPSAREQMTRPARDENSE